MRRHYVFKKRWKHLLARVFDGFGGLITFWMPRNQKIDAAGLKKILAARIDHLGDALLLRPALLRLRHAFPDLQIHLLTTPECAPIFTLDTFLDKVIVYPGHWYQKNIPIVQKIVAFFKMIFLIQKSRYDLAIDFRGDLRANMLFALAQVPLRAGYGVTGGGWLLTHEREWNGARHQTLVNFEMLAGLGLLNDSDEKENPAVRFPASTEPQLKHLMPDIFDRPYAVLHAGAGNPEKEWPFESFVELARRIMTLEDIRRVFFVGTLDEKKRSKEMDDAGLVDLRGQTDLHELACLLAGAKLFAGNDSGPAHLAAAQGIPVAVIASSTNQIEYWHPWTKKLTVIPSSSDQPAEVQTAVDEIKKLLSKKDQA